MVVTLWLRKYKLYSLIGLVKEETVSVDYIESYLKKQNKLRTHIDFSKPENFAKFGLAKKYYKSAIERIYKQYPYDGSLTENYNWVLNLGLGKNVPIVNYTLDKFSDGENNQSVILKLYQPLSNDIYNQYIVTLDKEVLATQKIDIYYIKEPEVKQTAQGLDIDSSENW